MGETTDMNDLDKEKQHKFLELFYPTLVETLARTLGKFGRQEGEVSMNIGDYANCIFGAAFMVLSHEYVRMDHNHFDDAEMLKGLQEVIQFNLKQFEANLPRDRAAYKEYLSRVVDLK